MSDRTGQSIEERVVALLKVNHKDLRAFVRAVEALAPSDGDVATFLDEMGAMLASDDRNVGAMELWEKAARLYEEQTRLEELAGLYANMGPVAATMGDIPRGIRFSLKAEELSGQLSPDPDLVYHVSSDLGAMYAELGDWEHAMYEDSRALEISRATDNYVGQIEVLIALAQVSIARGDLVAARTEAMGALSLAHFHADVHLEAESLRAVGDVSEATGEHEQAVRQYQQGLTLEATSPDSEIRAQLHYGLSVAYDSMGEAARAAEERNLTEESGLPGEAEDLDSGD
ncbi:MAG: tetratricopeptide repeat protein [Candidatus Cryosericum sp.]